MASVATESRRFLRFGLELRLALAHAWRASQSDSTGHWTLPDDCDRPV
jgi:hypothetical protein